MAKVINLDEVGEKLVFVLGKNEYAMLDMTAETGLKWNELRRKRDRLERRIAEQQEKTKNPELNEKQLDEFDKQLSELDRSIASCDASTLALVLDGMTVESAMKLSTLQRAKVMAEVTKSMSAAMEEMQAQLPKGEAPKP